MKKDNNIAIIGVIIFNSFNFWLLLELENKDFRLTLILDIPTYLQKERIRSLWGIN